MDFPNNKIITRRDDGSIRVTTHNTLPSKTDQQFKEDCDINSIVAKFRKTKQVTHLNTRKGVYADVSQLPDLITAGQQIRAAQDAFDALPSNVRKKFDNNPEKMIEFLQDPQNITEAEKLGLITERPSKTNNDDLNDDKHTGPKTHKNSPKPASKEKTPEDT